MVKKKENKTTERLKKKMKKTEKGEKLKKFHHQNKFAVLILL